MTDTSPADLLRQAADRARCSPSLAELLDTAAAMAEEYPELARDHDREVCEDYACGLMGATLALARQLLSQPAQQTGQTAPHGPHSPTGAPEDPATRDRTAQSRTGDRLTHQTVEYLLQTRQPDDTWEVSSGAMDAPDWAEERLVQRRERMPQFEHRIAKRTFTVAIEPYPDTAPDSRTDSPDSTPDTQTDSAATSADTVRTTPDNGPDNALREQYVATLRDFPIALWTPEALADRILSIRDRRMEQITNRLIYAAHVAADERGRAYNAERRADLADDVTARTKELMTRRTETLRARAEQAEADRNSIALEAGAAHIQLAAALSRPRDTPREDLAAIAAEYKERAEEAEAAITRVRALRERARTIAPEAQGPTWAGLEATLDESPGQPHPNEAEPHQAYPDRPCGQDRPAHSAHRYMLGGRGYQCPGAIPNTAAAAEQPAPPTTYAQAQQRHIQLLRRRHAARQAMDDAWDRLEDAVIHDLVRLASADDNTKER
ncbi:hypothetical protein [Streptomyces sp. DASNCL29]|uniref:hypothetical protein n=1 Tax=Streptomyces sp. DASNCL29 TaxID=2583819 RepID=UPI00110FF393|nr:hypothetical protein [Streptomyces sp. DASNCL29]TMU98075.1 hypothetical protein FGK60_09595 [Streptomyces sp. DASNCL29]